MHYAAPVVLRLRPFEYAHITNENDNTTTLMVGPRNYTLSTNESVVKPATPFHVIPHDHYGIIANPVVTTKDDKGVVRPALDASDQVKCKVGEKEYRFNVEPFALFPDESLEAIEPLQVVSSTECLVIHVVTAYDNRKEGESFLVKGPATYYPRVEEEVIRRQTAATVLRHTGLHLKALTEFTHPLTGEAHYTNEQYLYTKPGMYFIDPKEVIEKVVDAQNLLNSGLHVEVLRDFLDTRDFAKGAKRKSGDVYLVTGEECPYFLPHPYETVKREVKKVSVSSSQYCVVVSASGARKVVTNDFFYLKPGESVEEGSPNQVYLLSKDQAVLVKALSDFSEEDGTKRYRGDRWLIKGPCQFIPSATMVIETDPLTGTDVREKVVLIDGEGVYVRNKTSGETRLVSGPTSYLLEANEEIFEKPIPFKVRQLLNHQNRTHTANVGIVATDSDSDWCEEESSSFVRGAVRMTKDQKAVVFHIPYSSVTQLYNYKSQESRIVFGPDRIMLEPDEEFTVISLSGSPWDPQQPTKCLPKVPHLIHALYLFLGPSNMTDVVHVETRDHAQLVLQLCYDWYFDIKHGDTEAAMKCFSVNDFVGDACSFIASSIRAAVASMFFEDFHKNSAALLKEAVFGVDPTTKKTRTELRFPSNHLVITSVDAQEMAVSDERTRQGLQKSVKMAIELTTHAQEANAHQVASAQEQDARGKLERQRMTDQVANEEQRKILLEVENKGYAYTHAGKSMALAEAASQSSAIEGNAMLSASHLRAQKEELLHQVMSEAQEKKRVMLQEHERALSEAQSVLESQLADIKLGLMEHVVAALGPSTIGEISKAGPELQVKLLSSLGLEGYLLTDGKAPINLFRTAEGLTASPSTPAEK